MNKSPPENGISTDDSLQTEISRDTLGILNLTSRLKRYENAKALSKRNAEYIVTQGKKYTKLAQNLSSCSDYLTFHNYYTIDEVRLVDAYFCKKHMLCPMCARRRAAKLIGTYLSKFNQVLKDNPELTPYFITKTVRNDKDLNKAFKHLKESERVFRKRKSRKNTESESRKIQGGVTSIEITYNNETSEWHPHSHTIALCLGSPDQYTLSAEWHRITGDSFIVDVRAVSQEQFTHSLLELFKYVTKFHELDAERTFFLFESLLGKRTIQSFGNLYGLPTEPDSLTDEILSDALPYIEYVYRFIEHNYMLSPR